ncbi:hypothetical protein FJT64_004760 [Amphibalanus amphitrite]|uniref:Uncharacterized protein n=1 Tax=Amphibalanus amphitrite TaxID=1232801 RepID=A0A6A4VYE6_AMPAM|nr:hypothetical protein FJT64_004760 [Amphibalanus amphitrite]
MLYSVQHQVYSIKIFLFADQLEYDEPMQEKVQRMAQFLLLFYVVAWLRVPVAEDAPANDLNLYRSLVRYRQSRERWVILAVTLAVLLPCTSAQARSASVLQWNRHVDTSNNWRPVSTHRDASVWSPGGVSQTQRRVYYPTQYSDYDYEDEDDDYVAAPTPAPYAFWQQWRPTKLLRGVLETHNESSDNDDDNDGEDDNADYHDDRAGDDGSRRVDDHPTTWRVPLEPIRHPVSSTKTETDEKAHIDDHNDNNDDYPESYDLYPTPPPYPNSSPYYYNTHHQGTSPHPYPFYNRPHPVDKIDGPRRPFRRPNPPNVPFYYNTEQTDPEPPPKVNLQQLFGSVVQLVKSDGPSMMSALGDAMGAVQEGNYMGAIQSVMPVLGQATPVIMNVINTVGPALEKSDIFGQAVEGGGLNSLVTIFTNSLNGRPLPPRPQSYGYIDKSDTDDFNRPYYLGRIIGSGLKLATYLINFGSSVVRARDAGRAMPDFDTVAFETAFQEEIRWVQEAIGEENLAFLRDWADGRFR